jgi:hypothetical protein
MNPLTDEEVKKRFEQYVAEHQDELEEKVDKKIGTAINSAISNAFAYDGWARSLVYNLVQDKAKRYVDEHPVEVDIKAVAERLRKNAERAAKKPTVQLAMKKPGEK